MRPKIAFMGTPDFSVHSLQALIDSGYPIVAVITQPDKPKGRGQSVLPPPVKILAQTNGLNVIQPVKITPEVVETLRGLGVQAIVISAFGQILKDDILSLPPLGCINIHPSLLPKYRGAAPINWSVIRGETTTGVTIMRMDAGVDTGDIILQREEQIAERENAGSLQMRLAMRGSQLLLEALELVVRGEATYTKQDERSATYAPRITKEDTKIDWEQSGRDIENLIRGLSPSPCAYSLLDGKVFKLYQAFAVSAEHNQPTGTIGTVTSDGLPVAVRDGFVYLQDIQMESKKRMPATKFLSGYKIRSANIKL